MKIGIDIRALTENKTTGVQVYIENLLVELNKIDSSNEYILFSNSLKQVKISGLPDSENIQFVHTRYPNKIFSLLQSWFGYPKLDKLIGSVDLFFSPHWRSAALSENVPLVLTIHDLSFLTVPEYFSLKQKLWHWMMRYKKAVNRANHLIAVSESTKQDLIDIYNVPEEKISVIYSGVKKRKKAERDSADLPDDYFLHLATFEPRKNLQSVITAYADYYEKSNQKKDLVLAGSRGWKTDLNIPKSIQEHVHIFTDVADNFKHQLLQNAFALLFISFYEGFGFPPLEAMQYGVPVISSYGTSLNEVGKQGVLFVNPFRSKQLAETMSELEKSTKLYNDLSVRGIQLSKTFSWQKTAEKTLDLFNKVKARAK